MKKTLTGIIALLFIGVFTANAQSSKEKPPPPPPVKADVIEKVQPPPPPPLITVKGKIADEFYKRNPSVAGMSRQGDILIMKKKDGTEEKYDMSKKEEEKIFTDKYGDAPIPPPPPPPAPPRPKKMS